MNMKKLILWVLMCIMILSFTACGSKAETGEAAPFESGEQTTVITDETADSTAAADSVSTEPAPDWWPDNELAKAIPVFTKGSLMNVMDTDKGFIIALETVESIDYDAYLIKIKDAFSKDGTEANDSDMKTYVGSNGDGQKVSLIYDMNAKTLHISADAK
jgi:hypothetical protein